MGLALGGQVHRLRVRGRGWAGLGLTGHTLRLAAGLCVSLQPLRQLEPPA